ASLAEARDGEIERGRQLRGTQRLEQVGHDAGRPRALHQRLVGVAGEEHDRAVAGRELRRRLHAVAVGQPRGTDGDVGRGAPNDRQRVGAAHRLAHHFSAGRPDRRAKRRPRPLVTGAPGALAAQPELKTEEQKTLYALGLLVAQNLSSFALSPADLEIVKAGLTDGVANKEKKVDLQAYGPKIQEFQRARVTAAAVPERKAGQAFADKAAAEKGAVKTPSGAVVTTLKPGTGA